MTTACDPSISEWLSVFSRCVVEFSSTTLGCDDTEVSEAIEQLPTNKSGAYLTMISTDNSLQLGFVSDADGCRKLSGALLCMEPDEISELSNEDVADAMGEVINIIAGMIKMEISESVPSIQLGLPIFLDGQIELNFHQKAGAVAARIGDVNTHLVIVVQQNSEKKE